MIKVVLVLLMSVLVSGAGATLNEYYGVNSHIGSALVTIAVLAAYLIGFDRLVRIVSAIGPVVIIFLLSVGIISVFTDSSNFEEVHNYQSILIDSQPAPIGLLVRSFICH